MLILLCPPETKMQAETLWLGNLDSELTEESLNQHYDRIANDRAFIAPATHVRQFANMVLSQSPEVLPELSDRSMGSLTGRLYRETLAEFPRRNWLAWQRSYWTAPPDGESLFDVSDRVLQAVRTKIFPIRATETVVVVAGADVVRIIIGHLSRHEEAEIPKISIEPAIPYIINGNMEGL